MMICVPATLIGERWGNSDLGNKGKELKRRSEYQQRVGLRLRVN